MNRILIAVIAVLALAFIHERHKAKPPDQQAIDRAFNAGRSAALREFPRASFKVVDETCSAWLMQTNIARAKQNICSRR